MSCSQLSAVDLPLTAGQFSRFERYFMALSPNCKLTASKAALANELDLGLVQTVLQKLVEEKILKYAFGLRCPVCGLLLSTEEELPSIEKEQYCYQCDETVEITPDNVELVYEFDGRPFAAGQQIEEKFASYKSESAALPLDSLARLIASGKLDLNAAFFSPVEQEYRELQTAYHNIFTVKNTTKETGDSLEALTLQLFNLCRHFRAAPIRTHPNQIDCYVRNTLYIPGISQSSCTDSFMIECKNEAKAPTSGYMNKMHSILRNSGKLFGIIVSRYAAPGTFDTLSNKIFLNDKIVIISLDAADLKSIIFQRANLLECVSRKIDAVKLDATKELVPLGLYTA